MSADWIEFCVLRGSPADEYMRESIGDQINIEVDGHKIAGTVFVDGIKLVDGKSAVMYFVRK